MTETCRQCRASFSIYPEDRVFYAKFEVPEPTLCPNCRKQRRIAWRNERTFYERTCDQCKKDIISIYSPDKPFKIYCHDCWWGDDWNPLNYGQEYDSTRPFLEQFREVQLNVPRMALFNAESENSEYTNHAAHNKNCYYAVGGVFGCENVFTSRAVFDSKEVVDSSKLYGGELCAECYACENLYNVRYATYCASCRDSAFLEYCRNCEHCFGCVNLRNKKYCWFNKPVSPAEYGDKIKLFERGDVTEHEKLRQQYKEFLKSQPKPHAYVQQAENSLGHELMRCKNVYEGYDFPDAENCRYCESGAMAYDCMDCYAFGTGKDRTELLYEAHAVDGRMLKFVTHSWFSSDLEYCDNCQHCHDCFGGIGLKRDSFCLLNKQYSPAEFKALKQKIVAKMLRDKEYGEFIPLRYSPFAYNETLAQDYFPLTREKVEALGGYWREETVKTSGPEALKDVFSCSECQKNYRIIPASAKLYRRLGMPLPKTCPACRLRHQMRDNLYVTLFERTCARCNSEVQSVYTKQMAEKVLCEKCYQATVS